MKPHDIESATSGDKITPIYDETMLDLLQQKQAIADANLADATRNRESCQARGDIAGVKEWKEKETTFYNLWLDCVEQIAKISYARKSLC